MYVSIYQQDFTKEKLMYMSTSKNLIKWSELSRKLSGSNNSIRPNKVPKKYERKVNRLLWILDLWERWANRV